MAACLFLTTVLASCGSEEPGQPTAPAATAATAPESKSPPPLKLPATKDLYETGLELYAVGIASDAPGTIMQAISLLEQAALAEPENSGYWLDLADAYLHSGLAFQYPYAIDIYWLLLDGDELADNVLLSRLADAYGRVGDPQAAFEIGLEQLSRAKPDDSDRAALELALLALANDSFRPAAAAITAKAGTHPAPAYLLLLAASLEEAAGRPEAAVTLLDQALAKLANDAPAAAMARRERGRLAL